MNITRFFGGILVLFLGGVFIAVNQGFWDNSIWFTILALWPVLLIAAGLRLMIDDNRILSLSFLALAIFSVLCVFVNYPSSYKIPMVGIDGLDVNVGGELLNENLSDQYEIAEVKEMDISLATGAASVKLGVLPAGTSENTLYEVNTQNMGKLDIKKTTRGEKVIIIIEEKNVGIHVGPQMMTSREIVVYLPADLLVSLNLDSGASKLSLDFSGLNLVKADMNIGASSGDIFFGLNSNRQSVLIDAGASNLNFYVPERVGLEANLEGGLNKVDVGFAVDVEESKGTYRSKEFGSAETQISVMGDIGVSSIKFLRK